MNSTHKKVSIIALYTNVPIASLFRFGPSIKSLIINSFHLLPNICTVIATSQTCISYFFIITLTFIISIKQTFFSLINIIKDF